MDAAFGPRAVDVVVLVKAGRQARGLGRHATGVVEKEQIDVAEVEGAVDLSWERGREREREREEKKKCKCCGEN